MCFDSETESHQIGEDFFSCPGFKLANDSGRDLKLYLAESILLTEGW